MSIPECRLVLEERAKLQAADVLMATHSRYLASAAKWNEKAVDRLNEFQSNMREIVEQRPPRRASRADFLRLFAAVGIKPQS